MSAEEREHVVLAMFMEECRAEADRRLAPLFAEWGEGVRERIDADGTFGRVDLAAILRGDLPPAQPTMFARSDGQGLVYPEGRHDIHGEPGHGKSMIATAVAADDLAHDGRVVILDYEGTAALFVERALALGVPADVLEDPHRVAYFNPTHMTAADVTTFAAMVDAFNPTLIEVDAVGPAMGRQGLDEHDNTQVARWPADFVEPIRAGVTLLLIDHVSRDRQNRQRGGRGGWMKLQLLDVSYTVKTFKAFSRTQEGSLKLSCAKDRFGTYAIGEIVADIHVTPHDNGDRIDFEVRAPEEPDGPPPWRPSGLMERLSKGARTSHRRRRPTRPGRDPRPHPRPRPIQTAGARQPRRRRLRRRLPGRPPPPIPVGPPL